MLLSMPGASYCESYFSVQERRPDLFHEKTGYRIARHRAPTPDDIPGPAKLIGVADAARILERDGIAIDVAGALQSRFDELEGTWLVRGPRQSLPGAIWLPEVGCGVLELQVRAYLEDNLHRLTAGDKGRPVVVFCMADCWMSWNAARRIASFGYTSVYWLRDGTNGWADSGRRLTPVLPVPVRID